MDEQSLDAQIDFLHTPAWHALSSEAQIAYLRSLYQQFRREWPDDPDRATLGLLVAGAIDKIRRGNIVKR